MANSFDSNFTRQLARVFLEKFETERVHSKNVNTQLLKGRFSPKSGDKVDFKRPTDYLSVRTASGDITGLTSDIITGKATGTVQPYFTTFVDFDEADQAIKMDQIDELLDPLATRIVTDFELDFTSFMARNAGLVAGTVGVPAKIWDHIADAGAVMTSHGVPSDMPWTYTTNPFTQRNLASNQRSLGAGGTAGSMISESIRKATIETNFAGFDAVMTATTLKSYTTDSVADRVGTLDLNPDVTYLTAKDTMTQVLALTDFGANLQIRAGEVIQITGRNRLNLSTRQVILDEDQNQLVWTATVVDPVTLDGSGEGTITVTGPAIFEATGAYNTVDSAPLAGDIVTLLGTLSTTIQPNLFWHKQAFSVGSVPIKKLFSTDTIATTEDGLQIRVSKFSDGKANEQFVRFDFRPAYAALDPFMAGLGYGTV